MRKTHVECSGMLAKSEGDTLIVRHTSAIAKITGILDHFTCFDLFMTICFEFSLSFCNKNLNFCYKNSSFKSVS